MHPTSDSSQLLAFDPLSVFDGFAPAPLGQELGVSPFRYENTGRPDPGLQRHSGITVATPLGKG